ncbi:MAG: nucleotidyltransferase [Geminicoccales bacterium]
MTAANFPALIRRLATGGVEFIVIGGVAGAIHGSAHVTYHLDVLYRRTHDNIEMLAAALEPIQPYLRGVAPGLPFRLDPQTLERGLNFTLITTEGDLDLLGEVAGGGTYEHVLPETEAAEIDHVEFRCISLRGLILLKRAAGRPKDINVIAELETLLEERGRSE